MTKQLQQLVSRMQKLPEAEQEQYAKTFLAQLETVNQKKLADVQDERPIWEVIDEITSNVPDEIWDTLPKDGAAEVDHYLYGTPKKHS